MHSCKPAVKGAETGSLLASSLLRNHKPQGLRERLGLKGTSEWSVTETVFSSLCAHAQERSPVHTFGSVHTRVGVCTHVGVCTNTHIIYALK